MDVRRLFALFDIALDRGLVTLICHYVEEVCMDEAAVSSDPVLSLLLDPKLVLEWAQRTFTGIKRTLRDLYSSGITDRRMDDATCLAMRLQGISQVLATLQGPDDPLAQQQAQMQQGEGGRGGSGGSGATEGRKGHEWEAGRVAEAVGRASQVRVFEWGQREGVEGGKG
ncbi:unnamed protein product [Closterium sp. NIES-53]